MYCDDLPGCCVIVRERGTEYGVEIYVDGELIEVGSHGDDEMHVGHRVVDAHVEVICHTEHDCEKTVWVSGDEDVEFDAQHHEEHQHGERHEKIFIISNEEETSSH